MHARWVAAGNKATLAIYPGAIHGFNAFPIKAAARANQKIINFISQSLDYTVCHNNVPLK
jgi:acetyl esterase/lipase